MIEMMRYFLVAYDRRTGSIEELQEFADQTSALERRFELEDSRTNPDLELVVLGAQDKDDLVRTHSRYFRTVEQLAAS